MLAIWSASAGIYNVDRAIRDAYGLPRQRYVDARARSFAEAAVVVVALGALALLATAVLTGRGGLALAIGIPAVFLGIVAAVIGMLATYLAVYATLLGAVLNAELA